jgi:hypothetical protein
MNAEYAEYHATEILERIALGWTVIESTGDYMTLQAPEGDEFGEMVVDVRALVKQHKVVDRWEPTNAAARIVIVCSGDHVASILSSHTMCAGHPATALAKAIGDACIAPYGIGKTLKASEVAKQISRPRTRWFEWFLK